MATPIVRSADIFCRVIDNFGDIGMCWRLAQQLATSGLSVRLFTDDASALRWMAPAPVSDTAIAVLPWPCGDCGLADLVIETLGCGLPAGYLAAMANKASTSRARVWINLEHLSAEPYVERSHLLPSLQNAGPGMGLTCWFFYPGFTARTGGLLRERDIGTRQSAFDTVARAAWLAAHGITPYAGERLVSLFCYDNPNVPGLLRALGEQPTLLLTTPGFAREQVARALADASANAFSALRTHALPWLSQTDYDHLLWSCDLNFVRGEDSLVRAIWAGRPFVWQIYPQPDTAHAAKLNAFMSTARLHELKPDQPVDVGLVRPFLQWNLLHEREVAVGADTGKTQMWALLNCPATMSAWRAHCAAWRDTLADRPDLATELLAFAARQVAVEDAKIEGFSSVARNRTV